MENSNEGGAVHPEGLKTDTPIGARPSAAELNLEAGGEGNLQEEEEAVQVSLFPFHKIVQHFVLPAAASSGVVSIISLAFQAFPPENLHAIVFGFVLLVGALCGFILSEATESIERNPVRVTVILSCTFAVACMLLFLAFSSTGLSISILPVIAIHHCFLPIIFAFIGSGVITGVLFSLVAPLPQTAYFHKSMRTYWNFRRFVTCIGLLSLPFIQLTVSAYVGVTADFGIQATGSGLFPTGVCFMYPFIMGLCKLPLHALCRPLGGPNGAVFDSFEALLLGFAALPFRTVKMGYKVLVYPVFYRVIILQGGKGKGKGKEKGQQSEEEENELSGGPQGDLTLLPALPCRLRQENHHADMSLRDAEEEGGPKFIPDPISLSENPDKNAGGEFASPPPSVPDEGQKQTPGRPRNQHQPLSGKGTGEEPNQVTAASGPESRPTHTSLESGTPVVSSTSAPPLLQMHTQPTHAAAPPPSKKFNQIGFDSVTAEKTHSPPRPSRPIRCTSPTSPVMSQRASPVSLIASITQELGRVKSFATSRAASFFVTGNTVKERVKHFSRKFIHHQFVDIVSSTAVVIFVIASRFSLPTSLFGRMPPEVFVLSITVGAVEPFLEVFVSLTITAANIFLIGLLAIPLPSISFLSL
uniref:Uncharacterized protein n=1 Tax=Chromera velia CCMP2878 TaxID=1169474 RepID=A0A0G4I2Y9_9ALVE|eukprot:Cvel_10500.t1-p1 / transcript=Cvel_10500.t1 / gene=Cvel_10500 / organism=Chromera_velia_CCMP2878 / gene_product=hypothetical protein / transcript_product=hypothetical protein / location=Cvel_scaffold634:72560-76934(-) / protein_length=640 / sequence_SO=supercontig / SO=protein_coding / is_pseudo=false